MPDFPHFLKAHLCDCMECCIVKFGLSDNELQPICIGLLLVTSNLKTSSEKLQIPEFNNLTLSKPQEAFLLYNHDNYSTN